MWFRKKKTELEMLIGRHGKHAQELLEFAKSSGKARIEDITIDDVKAFYRSILALKTPFTAISHMKAIRIFFRENRGQNILRADLIRDDPLSSVVRNDTVAYMPIEKKRGKGRPPQVELIKKVISLREKGGLSFRAIGRAMNRDSTQVHVWYKRRQILLRGELSP